MALAFYFSPSAAMSADTYDECIKRLKKAGAGHPRGRVYHAAFKNGDAVNVFDVWTTQAAFDAFGSQFTQDPAKPATRIAHPAFRRGVEGRAMHWASILMCEWAEALWCEKPVPAALLQLLEKLR